MEITIIFALAAAALALMGWMITRARRRMSRMALLERIAVRARANVVIAHEAELAADDSA